MIEAWLTLTNALYDVLTVGSSEQNRLYTLYAIVLRDLESGKYARASEGTKLMISLGGLPTVHAIKLTDNLASFYAIIHDLHQNMSPSSSTNQAIKNLEAVAQRLECLGFLAAAYDFYEIAFFIAHIIDRNELGIARKLYELSDPEKKDQYQASLWRYCIEIIHHSILNQKQWLEAINAFEVALTVPVTNSELQQSLSDRMREVLEKGKDGLLDILRIVYVIQGPIHCVPPTQRNLFILTLNELKHETEKPQGDEKLWNESLEIIALIRSQSILEEIRYKLLEKKTENPNLTWHNLTLHHNFLQHAIPLGQSLIIDVNRTGNFVLELAHEITHALCLIGTVGYARTAFRTAIHALELEIIAASHHDSTEPLEYLPSEKSLLTLAEAQLKLTIKSSILEASWTPWLEGVAMYVELLADPKDDPFEILPVHEAVRSLIDFYIDQKNNEDKQEYSRRFADTMADNFDQFLSTAVCQKSSHRLLSYMETNVTVEKSGTYILGYLLVRSIVARWEQTIGERIKPVVAAKILLHATQYGTLDTIPDLTLDIENFEKDVKTKFLIWLDSLAILNKDDLNIFLIPVSRYQAGNPVYWKGGKPHLDGEDIKERKTLEKGYFERFVSMCQVLVTGAGISLNRPLIIQPQMTAEIFTTYLSLITLLPIGSDYVRILFANENGRIVLSPRTYVGLTTPTLSKNPKHSIHIIDLEGGSSEVQKIRNIVHELMTARALMTRVIDISPQGNTISKGKYTSFVCMFLGNDWHRVSLSAAHKPIGEEHSEFIQLVRKRIFPLPFYENESSVFSSSMLLKRLKYAQPEFKWNHDTFDRSKFSFELIVRVTARQLKVTTDEVNQLFLEILNDSSRYEVRDYLYESGFGRKGNINAINHLKITKIFFNTTLHSGIKPYNI